MIEQLIVSRSVGGKMNGDDWAHALRADSQDALRRLCDTVDGNLTHPVPQRDDKDGDPAGQIAGLGEFATAAVGAADLIGERTEAVLATLSPSPPALWDVFDTSVLLARGVSALERMRSQPAPPLGSPAPVTPPRAVVAPVTAVYPVSKLPRLEIARTVDDVIGRFDQIIDWAIEFGSGLGYFPTVYKRATVAIREKLRAGDYFDDNERMARFDVIFAQRYFDALNAYFHAGDYEAPTHVWQWCFDGHELDGPIMLQHMLTAVNSHVNVDLGVAAVTAAQGDLATLEGDFDRINTLLADEVSVFLDTLEELSPRMAVLRRLLPCETRALNDVLRMFRNLAWSFANQLDMYATRRHAYIGIQDAWAGVLGSYYLHTTETIDRLVRWVAETESRDIAYNVRVLAGRGD